MPRLFTWVVPHRNAEVHPIIVSDDRIWPLTSSSCERCIITTMAPAVNHSGASWKSYSTSLASVAARPRIRHLRRLCGSSITITFPPTPSYVPPTDVAIRE
jgi:hypothetical protein